MSLYSKKLHIKKPNNQIQIANLYTDKSDVGNNYLTFKDGNNIIYSALDVNGDIDCKVNKNNISYKIKKESSNVPTAKQNFTTTFTYNPPPNVKVIRFFVSPSQPMPNGFLNFSCYVRTEPNMTFNFISIFGVDASGNSFAIPIKSFLYITSLNGKKIDIIVSNGGQFSQHTYPKYESINCFIETSNDINNYTGQIYTLS